MKKTLTLLAVFLFASMVYAQKDTAEINKLIKKSKNLSNSIDPSNYPKNEQEAEALKKKILQQIDEQDIDPDAIDEEDMENYKQQSINNANKLKKKFSEYDPDKPVKKKTYKVQNIEIKSVSSEQAQAIAQRFYNKSYTALQAADKVKFDNELKLLQDAENKYKIAHRFTGKGANLTALGNDPDLACVYLTSALLNSPQDTVAINNFGAYLRIIDSVQTSLPVLLHAAMVCPNSPLILTQVGNSLFEMGDHNKAEKYFKDALKVNPDYGMAHSGLCAVYIVRGDAKNAMIELFKGAKTLFLPSTAKAYSNISKEFGNNKPSGEFPAKEILDAVSSESYDVDGDKQIKLPNFPVCNELEGWTTSGLFEATQRFSKFMSYNIAFSKSMQADYKTNSLQGQYGPEYFMTTSILSLIDTIHQREERKFLKEMDKLHKSNNGQNEKYLDKFMQYTKEYTACAMGCNGDSKCMDKCLKKFCTQNCPNADELNNLLKGNFDSFNSLFAKYRNAQRNNINDVYAFTQPWIDRIFSYEWSKICQYDRKTLVLKMIGSCYANYCYTSPSLQIGCEDCSIIFEPDELEMEDVEDKKVEGNDCTEGVKEKIELLICEISKDCDGVEFGCTAGVSASVKRNFRTKSTTVFAGLGGKAELGFADASGKAGFTYTRGDNGSEDFGVRVEGSASTGKGIKVGQSVEVNYTLGGGLDVGRASEVGIGF